MIFNKNKLEKKMMKDITKYLVFTLALLASNTAWAAEGAASTLGPIGAGLAVGMTVLGAAIGIGRVGDAALSAISRNPSADGKMFLPYILGFAMIEGVAIFGLVIALGLNK